MNCNTCKYFERIKENFGTCHRMPPIRNDRFDNTSMPNGFTHAVVYDTDWCGEYSDIRVSDKVDWTKAKK